jgi:4-aminobutyrate aminotransferase
MDTDGPILKTALPGPVAHAIILRDDRVMSTSYTRDYPFVMERGSGVFVEDVDGNVFLDCTAGIAVTTTGHAHPDVVEAVQRQAGRFLHMSGTDFYYEPQVRLGEELAAIAPLPGPHRVFLCNSGTEANEAALKLAKYHTERHAVIAFFGAFHGRTMGSLSVTGSRSHQRRRFGAFVPSVFHAPYADCYRCPLRLTPDSCEAECLDFIEDQLLVHVVAPEEVGAVIVEPIQGEGGYLVPPAVFHERLRHLTEQHGMLLIMDEVQSGMGRTGRMFAIEHTGVEPDIVTMAKGIASGMPLGAVTARSDVMSWAPGAHASTFGGNPVSCAAALATLKLLRTGLVAHAAAVGAHMMDALEGLMDKHPIIGDVRGRGLMIGLELVRDRVTKERATTERDAIVRECFKRGLLVQGAGRNVLRLSPPLVITSQQADAAVTILDEAIAAVTANAGAATVAV